MGRRRCCLDCDGGCFSCSGELAITTSVIGGTPDHTSESDYGACNYCLDGVALAFPETLTEASFISETPDPDWMSFEWPSLDDPDKTCVRIDRWNADCCIAVDVEQTYTDFLGAVNHEKFTLIEIQTVYERVTLHRHGSVWRVRIEVVVEWALIHLFQSIIDDDPDFYQPACPIDIDDVQGWRDEIPYDVYLHVTKAQRAYYDDREIDLCVDLLDEVELTHMASRQVEITDDPFDPIFGTTTLDTSESACISRINIAMPGFVPVTYTVCEPCVYETLPFQLSEGD